MTEQQKHTPGPWSLNQYGEPVDASGENIRAKGLALTNSEEAKANARLIAAAPDMLAIHRDSVEVLEIVLEEREEIVGEDEVLRDLISRIKEVVAKATGAAK